MVVNKNEREVTDIAPGPVSKKKIRPYPKRLFFIVLGIIGISMFLILTGGSAISKKPSERASRKDEPKYTGSEPTLNMADIPIDAPPEMPQYDDLPDNTFPAQPALNKQATQDKIVDRQWIDHQRMAHLSKSMVTDWPISSSAPADAVPETRQPMPPSTNQNSYLDMLLAQQGGTPSGGEHRDFFEKQMTAPGNLAHTRQPQGAPYKIPAGTIIPCVMITGINSDLPGNLTAQISENVYDWVKPYVCLIPQGSRVFGEYSSNIDFGQRRVQVRWTSITYPDGSSLNIEGMHGVDKSGYSGLHDKYYPHYGRMLTAAILTSVLTLLPDLILDETTSSSGTTVIVNTGDGNSTTKGEVAREAAKATADMGKKVFDKTLNAQPTVQIRPGTRINIQANADILFKQVWK